MKINNKQELPTKLQGENILETDCFTYLGSIVSKDGGADDDIKSRINKARHSFNSPAPHLELQSIIVPQRCCCGRTSNSLKKIKSLNFWVLEETNMEATHFFGSAFCEKNCIMSSSSQRLLDSVRSMSKAALLAEVRRGHASGMGAQHVLQ
ncbi:hypothetical protein C0Q70_19146 [Pomacea canaliculata]|uniref:Uncharacterized protein n=1 Tax=Pomacea canaliculata TaxID=400727 RepID=A0A2T7NIK0_POMCA|nr:hypothetical protein C0Q70_19146 [Pomacea canaliculata]